jgi:inorganic pyrophosphatase
MATQISKLKPFCDKRTLNVVIETPQGSRGKYKYHAKSGLFELSKIMPAGMEFPYDFGFVPGTRGQDGDPLDVRLGSSRPSKLKSPGRPCATTELLPFQWNLTEIRMAM